MSLNKRGVLLDTIIKVIIAGAGIFVLISLLFALYSPVYDEDGESAESYLKMFNEQLSLADSGGEGSLTFWGQGETKFYLVYLKSLSSFTDDDKDLTFVRARRNENVICVCYGDEGKMTCDDCKELDFLIELDGKDDSWALNPVRLKMVKSEGKYVFSRSD